MNNGIRHAKKIKIKTRSLRKKGLTHREIARILNVSLGSSWLWTRDIVLTVAQKQAIQKRKAEKTFTPERRQQLQKLAKKNLRNFWKKPYSKKDLIDKIHMFYKEHGRIPLKDDFNSYLVYQQRFGSWNNAIKAAGFEPNQVLFSKKFTASDGHICDSFTETIIDDWLSNNKIVHDKNFNYGRTKFTADFFIAPNILIEFFGLAGTMKHYDKIIAIKRKLCRKLNFKLIEIYPKDIRPKNKLRSLIKV